MRLMPRAPHAIGDTCNIIRLAPRVHNSNNGGGAWWCREGERDAREGKQRRELEKKGVREKEREREKLRERGESTHAKFSA